MLPSYFTSNRQASEPQKNIPTLFLVLFWIIILPAIGLGQGGWLLDTAAIYKKAAQAPRCVAKTPETLAKYLTADYTDEPRKVLAISYWIAKNIKYNYKAFKKRIVLKSSSLTVLKTKRALCGEYAQLFKEMCAAVGIQAEVVRGYTKGFDFYENDTLYRAEHAWSIVRIDGVWNLMDLTYGSGYTTKKEQPFKRFLARTFGLKYIPKFKYVHHFNKEWFYVSPDELIFTHFPLLNMYQLLKVPLPHKLFKQGGWSIHGHLSWYYETLRENPQIDAYICKTPIEKWLYEAEEGYKTNKANHRVRGLNYYLALDRMFRTAFEDDSSGTNISTKQLQLMCDYAAIADSMLQLSITDNEREYQNKEALSMAWRKRLIDNNKDHLNNLGIREKMNQKQEGLIYNIEAKKNLNQRLVTEYAHRYHEAAIFRTERPLSSKFDEPELSLKLLNRIDSLQAVARLAIAQKDSFLTLYSKLGSEKVCPKEEIITKIHKGNWNGLKQHLKTKKVLFDFVYEDSNYLDKVWFANSHKRADSINRAITDTVLLSLHSNQVLSYKLVKAYSETIDLQLKLIRKVKSKSIQNLREDAMYLEAVAALEKELKHYQTNLKDALGFQKKLLGLLRKQIKFMQKSEKTLAADNLLENYRHEEYMEYRNFIKNAENERMRLVLGEVFKIKSYIVQGMKNK